MSTFHKASGWEQQSWEAATLDNGQRRIFKEMTMELRPMGGERVEICSKVRMFQADRTACARPKDQKESAHPRNKAKG